MDFELIKETQFKWKILHHGNMNTDGIVYTFENDIDTIRSDNSLSQVINVATLPGIVGPSMAMPDVHYGYGFPIGGVAAFDYKTGIISPGGVGFDINCGVRLLTTPFFKNEFRDYNKDILYSLFSKIPSGVGSSHKHGKLKRKDIDKYLSKGACEAVSKGFGLNKDLENIESFGTLKDTDPNLISDKAFERGKDQLGTLGSGNHFIEVGFVEEIYDEKTATQFGLQKNMITVFIHTGSRALGHQVCEDYIKSMQTAAQKYGITVCDRQLACAPFNSNEGQNYFKAMNGAANFAFANRQLITHFVREAFDNVFRNKCSENIKVVYDVAHNIAKLEEHSYEGKKRKLVVHRKGATRAFPPNHHELPSKFQTTGQPVLIPGDMGRGSFVLAGIQSGSETFYSTCHGAGRQLSRMQAKKESTKRDIRKDLALQGILVLAASKETLREEFPLAYKDVSKVVDAVVEAKLCNKVAKLTPLSVIKG